MAVVASTATPVNSCRMSRWIFCGTKAILAISAATVSSSCSSRCFITWAAASGPMITRSVASFCTFDIFETSRGAAWFSAGAAITRSVALARARQPGTDGLSHVGGVFFDERVEDFDGHHARFGFVAPALQPRAIQVAVGAAEGLALAERHADGDIAGRRSFEQLEEGHED